MLLLFFGIAAAIAALAHTAPFPFAIDAVHAGRVIWRMPHADRPPTIYLTYDDGPNPTATPDVLPVEPEARRSSRSRVTVAVKPVLPGVGG